MIRTLVTGIVAFSMLAGVASARPYHHRDYYRVAYYQHRDPGEHALVGGAIGVGAGAAIGCLVTLPLCAPGAAIGAAVGGGTGAVAGAATSN